MTTFEFFVLLALGIIVLSVMFGGYVMCRAFDKIISNQDAVQQDIQRIEVNTHHASSVLQDHIAPDVESISSNFLYLLDESKGLPFKIDWDKLSKEQQDEFLKRLIMPNYDSPFQPPFNPTCDITDKED